MRQNNKRFKDNCQGGVYKLAIFLWKVHGKKSGDPSQAEACLQGVEPKGSIPPKRQKGATGFCVLLPPMLAYFLQVKIIRRDPLQLASGSLHLRGERR